MTPEELFMKNQRLVYYCLKGVTCPPAWTEDCIQEGMLELWRVCQKYKPDLGYAFATYAVPCIRGAMQRFARDFVSVIKIPRPMFDDGTYTEVQVSSLNELMNDENSADEFINFVPAEPDFYEELFQESLEDFLETIPVGRQRDIAEEVLYGGAYGDRPTQKMLAEKYGYSQPMVSRMRTKILKAFKEFLNGVDKGGDVDEEK